MTLERDMLYTVTEVAAITKFHPMTIYKAIWEKALVAHKVGRGWRVWGRDVQAWINGR